MCLIFKALFNVIRSYNPMNTAFVTYLVDLTVVGLLLLLLTMAKNKYLAKKVYTICTHSNL